MKIMSIHKAKSPVLSKHNYRNKVLEKNKFEKILKFFTKTTIIDKVRQKLIKIYFNFDKICTIIKVFSGSNVKGVKK